MPTGELPADHAGTRAIKMKTHEAQKKQAYNEKK
jgi:hypothetical protein